MALTKTNEIGKIEIVSEFRHIQIRRDVVIKEDGIELSRSYDRKVIDCGLVDESNNFIDRDVSGEDSEIQEIANVVWTQTVKDSWKAKVIEDRTLQETNKTEKENI